MLARSFLVVIVLCLPASALARQQDAAGQAEILPIKDFLMPEQYEIALARSAAPADVSNAAGVYVLKETGYKLVEEGTNGVICYVVRSWGRPVRFRPDRAAYLPAYQVPECLDRKAAEVILPMQMFKTQMVIDQMTPEDMNRKLAEAFASGALKRTQSVSFSYMLSNENRYRKDVKGGPHIMVYLPDDYTNDLLGLTGENREYIFVEGGPDEPYTAAVIRKPGIDVAVK